MIKLYIGKRLYVPNTFMMLENKNKSLSIELEENDCIKPFMGGVIKRKDIVKLIKFLQKEITKIDNKEINDECPEA